MGVQSRDGASAAILAEYAHKLAIIELTTPWRERGPKIAALMVERSDRLQDDARHRDSRVREFRRAQSAALSRCQKAERSAFKAAKRSTSTVQLHAPP